MLACIMAFTVSFSLCFINLAIPNLPAVTCTLRCPSLQFIHGIIKDKSAMAATSSSRRRAVTS